MNKRVYRLMLWALAIPVMTALPALGNEGYPDDESLFTWRTSSRWQAGMLFTHVNREVTGEDLALKLRGDIMDVSLGVSLRPWLLLYGQAGGSQASFSHLARNEFSTGAGGLLGAQLNLWHIYPARETTAWRLLFQAIGEVSYRTARDNGSGKLNWTTGTIILPLRYHLSMSRSSGNFSTGELHSLAVFAGPEFSWVDGTWNIGHVKRSFHEEDSLGVVVGADVWLFPNFSFGARADWLGNHASAQANLRYYF